MAEVAPAAPAPADTHTHVRQMGSGSLAALMGILLLIYNQGKDLPLPVLCAATVISVAVMICYTLIVIWHLRCEAQKCIASPTTKTAALLLLCALPFLAGCGARPEQDATLAKAQADLIAHEKDVHAIDEAFLQFYRVQMTAEIDRQADALLARETLPGNMQIVQKMRLEKYSLVENQIVAMRAKIAAADLNAANAMARLGALQQYLSQSSTNAQTLNTSTDQLLGLLEKFLQIKHPAAAEILPAPAPPNQAPLN